MSDQDPNNPPVADPVNPADPADLNSSPTPTSNPFDDLLGKIVRDDGTPKYASAEAAMTALAASQDHIKVIEAEIAELKEKDSKAVAMADILEEVKRGQAPADPATPIAAQSPEDIAALVDTTIERRATEATAQANAETVQATLTKKFGTVEAAGQAYLKAAADLGVSKDFIDDIARTSPGALFQLMGLDKNIAEPAPIIPNAVNPASFSGNPDPKDEAIKTVMGPEHSTTDVLDAWRKHGKAAEEAHSNP